ncbi:DUF2922 domain-containing protein [Paucilactobacillus wasatchensis]|uniref:DUF2922 domain-containing protein n=1 Tax=Paucilactobacillus wasatchensis TaxID=1335616 RepID=A0A0D1A6K5_9LACO|nr:DUF2922 domain-containing protein [Paucilactobacillus wasatchensis]KIS03505.1 hypothetical protein WDC_0877 [Paucilactobacillus wasatchensis]
MKSLNLLFKGNLGKTHTLKLAYANDNLDAKTVKATMDKLAELDLFVSNGEKIYAQPVSAKYIETTVTPVYSASEEPVPTV